MKVTSVAIQLNSNLKITLRLALEVLFAFYADFVFFTCKDYLHLLFLYQARPTVEWFVPIRSIHNGDPDETECLCIPGHPTLRNFLQDNYDNLVERSVEESRYILNFSFRLTKTCDVL